MKKYLFLFMMVFLFLGMENISASAVTVNFDPHTGTTFTYNGITYNHFMYTKTTPNGWMNFVFYNDAAVMSGYRHLFNAKGKPDLTNWSVVVQRVSSYNPSNGAIDPNKFIRFQCSAVLTDCYLFNNVYSNGVSIYGWPYSANTPYSTLPTGLNVSEMITSENIGLLDWTTLADTGNDFFVANAAHPTCTSWTYSNWGECQFYGTQTRTVLTSSPSGCTGGAPVTTQSCNYVTPPQLTVAVEPLTGGSITGSGIDCGVGSTNVCQEDYTSQEEIVLTANHAPGYAFAYWREGTTQVVDNPYLGIMVADKSLTAVFKFAFAFPLANYTPYTAPVSSVFDHTATAGYASDTNHHVTAFNGEMSDNQNLYSGTTCYPKVDSSAFGSGFNYTGISGAGSYYLCYDGHPGTDYPVGNSSTHIPVYAAADGIAHIPTSFPGYGSAQIYNTVEVDHSNGYKTYYLHLYSQNVTENQQVYKGQTIIGYSGDTGSTGAYHLHFEVQKDGVPVDPYGWTGSGSDPYTRAIDITLWE